MAVTFTGVSPNQIGETYSVAIGYDDGTGTVRMVGYVTTKETEWEQTPNINDEGQLIAVASPNQIDRNLTPWPRVSQGDWSAGEQQKTYINPARYRSSDGAVDTSRPGELQLYPGVRTTTYTATGLSNLCPIVALGDEWFCGVKTAGTNLVYATTASVNTISIGDGNEILDIIVIPFGVTIATSGGIWTITGAPVATLACTEGVASFDTGAGCPKAMAYFGDEVYFITTDQKKIKKISRASTTPVVFRTANNPGYEEHYKLICSTANGLFYVTYHIGSEWDMVFYTSDGGAGPDTRIASVMGKIEYASEIYGVTYILVRNFQAANHNDFTLYALQGTALTVVLDMRWVPDEFKEVGSISGVSTSDVHGNVWGDGRFLYIGWPGMQGLRIDLTPGLNATVSRCTVFNPTASGTHKVVSSDANGIISANAYVLGGVLKVTLSEYFQAPTAGTITLSDFDFDTPGESKAFRAVFIELNSPMPAGGTIVVTTDVDGSGTYTATQMIVDSPTRLTYRIPRGTIGRRLSIRMVITNGAGVSPVIRVVTAEGTLARVFKATLECFQEQQLLDSSVDGQGENSQALLGNIEGAFETAGRKVWMYIPSLTNPSRVETIQAELAEYSWKTPRPGANGIIEGTMDVTLKETV